MNQPADAADRTAGENTLPPPPPGTRHVRLPLCPTIIADDDCRRRVDRWFFWPMILLALAVLPLIAIELWYLDRTEGADREFLGWLCWIGFAMISLAFLVEFLVKIAIAESRLEYVKRNWIDVIIIVIPALRPLRATALVKGSRVFKLRGVGMKLCRYAFTFVVGLEATDRYAKKYGLRAADGRKPPERMTRQELVTELTKLRRRCDSWEAWYDAHESFLCNGSGTADPASATRAMPPRPVVSAEAVDTLAPPTTVSDPATAPRRASSDQQIVPG
jgi:hypothetical protein